MATVINGKEWIFNTILEAIQDNKINIDGAVYYDIKPTNDKEDIVVNSILMNNEFFQNGIFNVNCYIPDIKIFQEGKEFFVPNKSRIKEISEEVYPVLHDNTKRQSYRFYIDEMEEFREQNENTTYLNFRIQLNAKNKNYY